MTREEAARILDPKTTEEAYNDITHGYASKYWLSKWYNAKSEACKMGVEALRELDAQEKQKPFGEWISVKDKLPETDVAVLARCCYHECWQTLVCYCSKRNTGRWYTNVAGQWVQVTHWMPLPEPPKEDSK